MGVGHSASPLHRVVQMDMSGLTTRPLVKASLSAADSIAEVLGTHVGDGPVHFHSPSIVAWRRRLTTKYRDQLGEELAWDEGSTFEISEDVAVSADVMFRYAAAVLDQRGRSELGTLIGRGEPAFQELDEAFDESSRRGFGGKFPHLLLGANYWLPYKRQLIIEEPNWDGRLDRYGSVYHLVDEITAVRAAMSEMQPAVASVSAQEAPQNVLEAACQASETISRLAAVAASKQVPLWTTG